MRGASRASCADDPAERLGQRQVGRDRLGGLGREERRVDRVAGRAAVEHVEDLLARPPPRRATWASAVEAPRWGVRSGVGGVEERRSRGRLGVEHVDAGAADLARRASASASVLLVDHAAAGHVEQHARPASCLLDDGRVDQAAVVPLFLGTWTVIASERGDEVVEGRRAPRRRFAAWSGVTNGSEPMHRHLHGPGADGDGLADLAQAHDAQGLAAQLHRR